MLKIFLSSHGHFASGMKSSLDILLGESKKVTVFDAYLDVNTVQEKLEEFYRCVEENDEVILLSDLYGGSVNQVMFTYLDKPKTRLVAGVNLALVLELASKEQISDSELVELVEMSKQMIVFVKQEEIQNQEEFF